MSCLLHPQLWPEAGRTAEFRLGAHRTKADKNFKKKFQGLDPAALKLLPHFAPFASNLSAIWPWPLRPTGCLTRGL